MSEEWNYVKLSELSPAPEPSAILGKTIPPHCTSQLGFHELEMDFYWKTADWLDHLELQCIHCGKKEVFRAEEWVHVPPPA